MNRDNDVKRCLFLAVWIILVGWTSEMSGQPVQKYWIYFTDKETPAVMLQKRTLNRREAAAYISENAIKRRMKVMPENRLIDEADLPVNERYIRQLGSYGIHPSNILRWFNAITAYLSADQVQEISHTPFIRSIVPVRTITRRMEPREAQLVIPPMRSQRTTSAINHGAAEAQLRAVNIIPVHQAGVTGRNIIIGILDTGFRWKSNPALMGINVLAEYDFIFKDSVTANESQDTPDQDSHGTNTLSILGANLDGVYVGAAPEASFILAKTEDIRSETKVEEDNWAAAIEWMENLGVDVVSCSLGYSDFDPHGSNPGDYTWSNGDFNGRTTITAQAALLAARRGVVVVTCMGNEGNGDGVTGTLITPADADSIISVGAVRYMMPDSGDLASFSSTGPTNDGRIKPDVVAPGVGVAIVTPDGAIITGNGTSYSTPLAAGVAALVLSANPSLTPVQVRNALRNTATNASSPDNYYGWGEVNAFAAVNYFDSIPIHPPHVSSFALYQNYPNPFSAGGGSASGGNGTTIIRYDIPEESPVTVVVYSVLGEKVRILVDGMQLYNQCSVVWDGKNSNGVQLPSGIYFVSLSTPRYTSTKKIILLR
jgi:serine protease AprX